MNTTDSERWLKVVDWPDYSVSSLGRVRRDVRGGVWPAGRMLKPCLNGLNRTYLYVVLSRPQKHQTIRLANIVAAAFIGPRPEGKHINHIDGNRHTKGEALAALRDHIDLQKPMIGAMSADETARARRELDLP